MRSSLAAWVTLSVFLVGAGSVLAQERKAGEAKASDTVKTPASAKAAMKARTVVGVVKSAQADGIVVSGRETGGTKEQAKDRDWAIALNDKTVIKRGPTAVASSQLKAGDEVTVSYTENDGKVIALGVTVKDAAVGTTPAAREVPAAKK